MRRGNKLVGSMVVDQSTHNPNIEGLNPPTGTGIETMAWSETRRSCQAVNKFHFKDTIFYCV
jgi:hypothetical protein